MCIDKCNVKTSQMITNKSKKSKFASKEDLEVIGPKIRSLKLFQRMHPNVLQEILGHGVIEHIDKGVVRKYSLFYSPHNSHGSKVSEHYTESGQIEILSFNLIQRAA